MKKIDPRAMRKTISKIKEKKEFSKINDKFIKEELKKYLQENKKALHAVIEERTRSEEYKKAVKAVRAVLRRVYSLFLTKETKEREDFLEHLKHAPTKLTHKKILQTHKSTKERIPTYPVIYDKIFAITGKPKVILDLGCGLNPVSYPWMGITARYYAAELNEEDCKFLNKYFEIMRIKGKAVQMNLKQAAKNPEMLKVFPTADVCFLFKVLDEIERKKGRKLSESLIRNINADWLVISFATKKVTGKPMKHPYRRWLEQMLARLGHEYEIIKEGNEILYVVRKSLNR
ncbi:hypothetical protein GF343_00930 [Candidatus Woesearchaeota archaeon]|nr:hypothetical protein [Candidatus Woesearchaeota archaeon]